MIRYADRSLWAPRDKIEAYVVGLCAGFAAQRRFDPHQLEEVVLGVAECDFEMADVWSDVLSLDEGLARAQALILDHWAKVELIARALLAKRRLEVGEAEFL